MQNASLPSTHAPGRLRSIDALRGLCALVVFLTHWHLWSSVPPQGPGESAMRTALAAVMDTIGVLTWPTGGHHPAVIAFFVLSGFCIHYPYARRAALGDSAPAWGDYFRRRFVRIMPVYWTASLLGLAFVAAETLRPTGHPLLQLHALASLEHVLVRLSGISGIYPEEVFAGNYILITVAVEMVAYLLYPLVHACALRGQWRSLGLGVLAMHLAAVVLIPYLPPVWVFNSILMLALFWFAGAWAAHLFVARGAQVHGGWLLFAWAAFLILKALPRFFGLSLLKQAAWGVVCVLGILWALKREMRDARFVEQAPVRLLRRVGEVSYSLYAVHTPAIMLATWALLTLGRPHYALQLAATMGASVLATWLVYHGVERAFYSRRAPLRGNVTRTAGGPLQS